MEIFSTFCVFEKFKLKAAAKQYFYSGANETSFHLSNCMFGPSGQLLNAIVLLLLTGRGIPKLPHCRVISVGFLFPLSKQKSLPPYSCFHISKHTLNMFKPIKKHFWVIQETFSQNQWNNVIPVFVNVHLELVLLPGSNSSDKTV